MFKFLWTYFKTYKKIFLVVILCSILISVSDLLTPYLTAKFIDEILTAGNVENFGNFISAFFYNQRCDYFFAMALVVRRKKKLRIFIEVKFFNWIPINQF